MPELTPSQTVGPYLRLGLDWGPAGPAVVPEGTPGAVRITGILYDGEGTPITDGLVETWQADPEGRFPHPEGGGSDFRGFGRSCTDDEGRWEVRTLLPGALPGEAPHLDVSVFARGLLDRVVTRVYLPDHPANATDPVLALVPAERRGTLVAERVGEAEYRFDIRLQGEAETVFLDV
ncbi:protocatechuate 3,4-dioxygenase subunit alpha [Pseudonocardia pini]|uniref:protocatechuate 3,4-dioxygenase subunit alpha n=1 Tax=Pseudonocardia pini TaxID=2758030 RepID=UPI0015F0A397|nr:protocatechuate 3,4-dioxygenase subunit alpha [Pseudonocardia pini]